MLKLKELRFKGIGRFVEEQVITFDSLGNMVQVDGLHGGTGGSSGSGKTTVFNSLDYLLGINDIPSSTLQSRLTDEHIWVQGKFDLDDKPLVMTRGKKLSIDLDGVVTTGSSKIAEEKLDEILAMPRSMFRPMLHKRQKEGGFFLDMTPSKINEFLTDCLGLGAYKKKLETIDAKVDELTKKKFQVASSLESARSALKATQDAAASLGQPPVKEMDQSAVLVLKKKADDSADILYSVQSAHRIEQEALALKRPQVTSVSFDRSVIEALEKEHSEVSKKIDTLKQEEKNRQNEAFKKHADMKIEKMRLEALINRGRVAGDQSVKLAGEIKKIRDSICPTCEQSWANEQAKMREMSLISELRTLRADIEASNSASQNIGAVNFSIEELLNETLPREVNLGDLVSSLQMAGLKLVEERQKEKDHQTQETLKNRAILSEFAESQKKLNDKHRIEADFARGQADLDRRALDAAVSKMKSYQDAISRYERSQSSLLDQEKSYSNKASELAESSIQVHNELLLADELKRAIKSYLSCSFDDALESIGDTATKIIRSIPNMASATVQLEGTRETKEGKVKEEVNAVIHMDGDTGIPIKSLCGGERSAIDLAVDLAVIDLIESKTNKGIDIFILDEPFTGLDTVCIEMALEVLKNSNTNKRLIIVDHNPEVKQMVESKLLVVRDGLTSRIQ